MSRAYAKGGGSIIEKGVGKKDVSEQSNEVRAEKPFYFNGVTGPAPNGRR